MKYNTFEAFSAASTDEGFDEILIREWQPNLALDTHAHPFDVSALVVRGEFKLTVGDQVTMLRAGDPFRLARDIPHAEHYGPEGATVWVARGAKTPAYVDFCVRNLVQLPRVARQLH